MADLHNWSNAPEPEWRMFVADHMERMAENQMDLSGKLDEFLANCSEARNKSGKDITDIKSNLKWLWVTGGIVLAGIEIAVGELWKKVF